VSKFVIQKYIRKSVLAIMGYVSEKQDSQKQLIRLNANENPFPVPTCIQVALENSIKCDLRLYPDEQATSVRCAIARAYKMAADQVIVDNGSSALLSTIFRTILDPNDVVAIVSPTFALYETLALAQSAVIEQVKMGNDGLFPTQQLLDLKPKLIVIPNPNAPMGYYIHVNELECLIHNCSGIVVIDEAYSDFTQENALHLVRKYPNVIITRTFSKAYSLAGLRFGFGFSSPEIIVNLDKVRSTYNINSITQIVAVAVFEHIDEFQESIKKIRVLREYARNELERRGFGVAPSETNFLFVTVPIDTISALQWECLLQEKGILVRCYPQDEDLRNNLRISIGSQQSMGCLFQVIDEILNNL
jgi:histidinol-phosphate aminotransferase